MPNDELMKMSRELLSGHWQLGVGVTLLMAGIPSVLGFVVANGLTLGGFKELTALTPILALFLHPGFLMWSARIYLAVARYQPARASLLLNGFQKAYGRSLWAFLLMATRIVLWAHLLFIPGIVAAYRFAMTFFILADHAELSASEALRQSAALMKGHKWALFCLSCRFVGWGLISVLTLGLGFLWLIPYASTAFARFYEMHREPLSMRYEDR